MMTVHKLTAGDGYTYLTRQVASADETRAPGQSLADYYAARGNPPGVWLGGGAHTLGVADGVVTEAQMRALFGRGRHPDAEAMQAAGAPERETRLGADFLRFGDGSERRPVAGYDLVFTPVKSVSVLWALGGPEYGRRSRTPTTRRSPRRSRWVEQHAAFTRTGHAGIAQVDTTGLVAAAFDHRESRSGDPDLHTHVAVANKVCGFDGKWRSLDARACMHSVGVAASERYNTRFEDALARRLGVRFAERPGGDAGQAAGPGGRRCSARAGPALLQAPGRDRGPVRRAATEYRHAQGREPDRTTQLRLAQQATLETREGKGPGRTMAEQVADWTEPGHRSARPTRLERMVADATAMDGHVVATRSTRQLVDRARACGRAHRLGGAVDVDPVERLRGGRAAAAWHPVRPTAAAGAATEAVVGRATGP